MHISKINAWADWWRYYIGVNIIPADGKNKRTWIKWKDDPKINMQYEPIPLEMHEEWKKTQAFKNGMAVICGKVYHNQKRKNLYLCAVDADNKKAIDELTEKGIEAISKKTLVEQHANPNKAHIYFYTTKPMQKKSSDATNTELLQKMKNDEIPALEMKGEGCHGIMYCTPSPHKDGSNYQVIGIDEPMVFDKIGEVVGKICDKYSLGKGKDNLIPMKLLMDDETKIIAGNNRHEAILRYAESLLRKYPDMEKTIFRDMIFAKNNRMCDPPLNEEEINKQIKDAINFISTQLEERKKAREYKKHLFGTDEFWTEVDHYNKAFHPKGKFIKCLECHKLIDADPFVRSHYGHRVKIET